MGRGTGDDADVPGWLSCLGFGGYSYNKVKWNYMLLLGVHVLLSWLSRDVGYSVYKHFHQFQPCQDASAVGSQTVEQAREFCVGKEAVLRLAFATFLFFTAHALLLAIIAFFTPEHPMARKVAHAGFFPLKLVIWFGLVAVCMTTMAPSVFSGFFQFARVAAGIFVLFQLVVLLDFVYAVNGAMVDNDAYQAPLIVLTTLLTAATLAAFAVLYHYFAPSATCSINIFYITFTLILSLVVTVISVSPIRTQAAGLLTSMLICAYAVFLLTSALYSRSPDECTPTPVDGDVTWLLVVGFLITLLCMVLAVLNMGKGSHVFGLENAVEGGADDEDLPYNAAFFHLVFALAVCYLLMLFLNWSLGGSADKFELDQGTASAWIKIVTQWICFGLYAWTLVAEKVLTGRSFG